eukprot:6101103-Pyramimonas_sp.AAC.3
MLGRSVWMLTVLAWSSMHPVVSQFPARPKGGLVGADLFESEDENLINNPLSDDLRVERSTFAPTDMWRWHGGGVEQAPASFSQLYMGGRIANINDLNKYLTNMGLASNDGQRRVILTTLDMGQVQL